MIEEHLCLDQIFLLHVFAFLVSKLHCKNVQKAEMQERAQLHVPLRFLTIQKKTVNMEKRQGNEREELAGVGAMLQCTQCFHKD